MSTRLSEKVDSNRSGAESNPLPFLRTSLFSGINAVLSFALLFILYRIVLEQVGMEAMGRWALVIAWMGVGRIAEFGVPLFYVRILVESECQGTGRFNTHVFTAFLVCAFAGAASVGLLAVLGVSLGPSSWGFHKEAHLVSGVAIYTFCQIISAPFRAALDASGRLALRQTWLTLQQGLLLLFAAFFIQSNGTDGLGYAHAASAIVSFCILVALVAFIRRHDRSPLALDRSLVKSILTRGGAAQAGMLSTNLFEPLTKVLLERFGGLDAVSVFELVSRLVGQVRTIVVSGMEAIVPYVAARQSGKEVIYGLLVRSVGDVSGVAMIAIVGLLPAISIYWLEGIHFTFILYGLILVVAWWINVVCGPAYFYFAGRGDGRAIIISNLSIGAMNVLFASLLGLVLGPLGVVIGWSVALVLGSLVLAKRSDAGLMATMRSIRPATAVFMPVFVSVVCLTAAVVEGMACVLIIAALALIGAFIIWFAGLRDFILGAIRSRANLPSAGL